VTAAPVASPSVRRDPRHHLGRLGEQLAAEHFERLGYAVLARNHRTRHGELDLIVHREGVLVFVEVKTRRAGEPWDNLHPRKRTQVRTMARAWLQEVRERPYTRELRFDGVAVLLDDEGGLVRLDHLEGAF
jgi:putative endonuclease